MPARIRLSKNLKTYPRGVLWVVVLWKRTHVATPEVSNDMVLHVTKLLQNVMRSFLHGFLRFCSVNKYPLKILNVTFCPNTSPCKGNDAVKFSFTALWTLQIRSERPKNLKCNVVFYFFILAHGMPAFSYRLKPKLPIQRTLSELCSQVRRVRGTWQFCCRMKTLPSCSFARVLNVGAWIAQGMSTYSLSLRNAETGHTLKQSSSISSSLLLCRLTRTSVIELCPMWAPAITTLVRTRTHFTSYWKKKKKKQKRAWR